MFSKCLIVEDQVIFAESLAISLTATELVRSHSIATSIQKAEEKIKKETFDLVIADLLFPEGNSNELIEALMHLPNRPTVLVLTSLSDPWHLQTVLTQPVDSILVKGESYQNLHAKLKALMPESKPKSISKSKGVELANALLSPREKDVLRALGKGETNQGIAQELGLSVRTVETHRRNIANKLNHRGGELVRLAVHFSDSRS